MHRMLLIVIVGVFVLHGCQGSNVPTIQSATPTGLATTSRPLAATQARVAASTATQARPKTPTLNPSPAATATSTASLQSPSPTASSGETRSDYIDNRSTAPLLMNSFVNALNRKEYARAYSYWQSDAPQLPAFAQFRQGYAGTASVQLTIGSVTGDVAAGQIRFSVPVTLVSRSSNGATQMSVGCYVLRLIRPDFQALPPFQPLAIESATVKQVASGANAASLMAQACPNTGKAPVRIPPFDPANIDASRYLDDRSDAVQVVRSLYNAINRHEFVRAYSYWEPAADLPPFAEFQKGYARTVSLQLTTGRVKSDTGAGQLNSSVPVLVVAQTRDGGVQTFAGCYTLHFSDPAIQTQPPFQPMGIRSGKLQQVPNGTAAANVDAGCP